MTPEADLDRLLRLVARMCQTPVAIATLIEGGRHRLLAPSAPVLRDPERLLAFSEETARQPVILMVANAALDARWSRHPLVKQDPHIRFYCGVPLVSDEGQVIGTLGVMDQVQRTLNDAQRDGLETLGRQIVAQLEVRRYRRVVAGLSSERERMNAMLMGQTNRFIDHADSTARMGSWVVELPSRRILWSGQVAEIYERVAAIGELSETYDYCVPEARENFMRVFDACIRDGTPFDEEMEVITGTGRRLWVRTIGHGIRDARGVITSVHGATQDITALKAAQGGNARLAQQLASTLESISDAFFTLDAEWRFVYLNTQSEKLLGRKRGQLIGQRVWEEFRRTVQFATGMEGGVDKVTRWPLEFERYYAPTKLWFEIRASPSDGGYAVYMRDVTERRQSQAQLRLLELSVSRLNDLVLITEEVPGGPGNPERQQLVFVNDAFERHTGWSRDEVMGRSPGLLQGARTQRDELERIRLALLAHEPVRAELINYRKHGEEFWIELDMVPVANERGRVTHWVAVGRDITQRKAVVAEIQHLAFVDSLTQLPNRLVLMDRLTTALPACAASGQHGALMFIDLDNFKTLNDTLGHDEGDMLLKLVARRLTGAAREGDTVARLGGDEFVVMLQGLGTDPALAEQRAWAAGQKILAALDAPYVLTGTQHESTCSIGLVTFDGRGTGVSDLLKQADLAMYQAKSAGRNNVCLFNPALQAAVTAHASLASDLRMSLREGHFLLHYQPQVDRDGGMSGVEALVRWQHPQRGLVGPAEFIPSAEDSGLILPLGQWVLETACDQLAVWAKNPRTAKLGIAVNVSVKQFRHPDFVDMVLEAIERSGISPYRLKLELTETLLADGMEVTIARMGTLKEMGVTLSLDDFGMGYSALSSLKRLPLDQLKIDKTFVRDILRDPNDAAIARAIIAMAQSLGLGVMAEGVENEAQRDFLARQGCHCYQGYLFSKPLPIDELEIFMNSLPLVPPGNPLDRQKNPGTWPGIV
ncbi:MAG: EAL domain-containing protein [Comamonadaceae bacterium]|nr:MAG: EAL domain-containing protein [Comamonadaceae bacterium]